MYQRFFKDERQEFMEFCLQALRERNRPYLMINGSWEERFARAVQAVENLLGTRGWQAPRGDHHFFAKRHPAVETRDGDVLRIGKRASEKPWYFREDLLLPSGEEW